MQIKNINELISEYREYKASGGSTSDFLYLNRLTIRELANMMYYADTGISSTSKVKTVPRYKTKCTTTETKRKQRANNR